MQLCYGKIRIDSRPARRIVLGVLPLATHSSVHTFRPLRQPSRPQSDQELSRLLVICYHSMSVGILNQYLFLSLPVFFILYLSLILPYHAHSSRKIRSKSLTYHQLLICLFPAFRTPLPWILCEGEAWGVNTL